MNYAICDMETDGLIETATKIHCLSVNQCHDDVWTAFTLIDPDEMREFFRTEEVIVGHNIIRFDIPVAEKLLGIKIKCKAIDTLALSWYLYPELYEHGLEAWGDQLGIPKPVIADWSNLTVEEYIYRCEEDVKINTKLFLLQGSYLYSLYDGDQSRIDRIVGYLMFKMDCAREMEEVKWKLDVAKCEEGLKKLHQEKEIKSDELRAVMPKIVEYRVATRPKVYKKKDGTLSELAKKWLKVLEEHNLPDYHNGDVKIKIGEKDGNPSAHQQIKNWLFSHGWIPETFKYKKDPINPFKYLTDVDGKPMTIPQLSLPAGEGLCPSVVKMFEKIPELRALEGLFTINHRIGILEGFLRDKDKDNFLQAQVTGFTNTLRFQHTTIVNLPTIFRPYGEICRGCLVAPDDDHELCGADVSGLEDSTKQHYMYYYDPDYVDEMREPNFDPHLDIAMRAGIMDLKTVNWYKWIREKKQKWQENVSEDMLAMSAEEEKELKQICAVGRDKSKKSNFAAIYGAGPSKIALTAGISFKEASVFYNTYWKRNWSVKKMVENLKVKTIGGQMWMLNPVAQLWYSLRLEKDKFSTLNQGTGVYCFDSWVRNVRKKGIRLCGQFHDELIAPLLDTERDFYDRSLRTAMNETNAELQLNVPLGISVAFGRSYADIH